MEIKTGKSKKGWVWSIFEGKEEILESKTKYTRRSSARRAADRFLELLAKAWKGDGISIDEMYE